MDDRKDIFKLDHAIFAWVSYEKNISPFGKKSAYYGNRKQANVASFRPSFAGDK